MSRYRELDACPWLNVVVVVALRFWSISRLICLTVRDLRTEFPDSVTLKLPLRLRFTTWFPGLRF